MVSNPTSGMDVCRECCVFSGRGLCDGLITRPEDSYRLLCVVRDLENLMNGRLWPTGGGRLLRQKQTNKSLVNTCLKFRTPLISKYFCHPEIILWAEYKMKMKDKVSCLVSMMLVSRQNRFTILVPLDSHDTGSLNKFTLIIYRFFIVTEIEGRGIGKRHLGGRALWNKLETLQAL